MGGWDAGVAGVLDEMIGLDELVGRGEMVGVHEMVGRDEVVGRDEMVGEGVDWDGLELALTIVDLGTVVDFVVAGAETKFVAFPDVDMVGNLHGGIAAVHWGWQLATAAPVPAQVWMTNVPGSGSHGQQLEQHPKQVGLLQPQPLAHPMKVLPTG